MKTRDHVRFYSKSDLTLAHNLELAGHVLDSFDENCAYDDVNDVLELATIHLLIKENLFLTDWDEKVIESYKKIVRKFSGRITRYIQDFLLRDFCNSYELIFFDYRQIFWQCVSNYGIYKCVELEKFNVWLKKYDSSLIYILENEPLTKRFSSVLVPHLINSKRAAEILIEKALYSPQRDVFWPSALTEDDKIQMVKNYIGREEANVNYLKKISLASRNANPRIDGTIRLLANEATRRYFEKIPKNIKCSFQISVLPTMDVPCRESETEKLWVFELNRDWVQNHLDFYSIMLMLSRGLGFERKNHISVLPRMDSDFSPILEAGTIGDSDEVYHGECLKFSLRRNIFSYKLLCYRNELFYNKIELEDVFKCFYEDYLQETLGICGFSFTPPSENTNILERIKITLPEIERVLKSYNLFVTKGFVDECLLNSSSSPLGDAGSLPSNISQKYAYGVEKRYQEMNILFSSLLNLAPLHKSGEKIYDSFYERLLAEIVYKKDIPANYWTVLDDLLKTGFITIDNNDGRIVMNPIRCKLLKTVYDEEVICFQNLSTEERLELDDIVAKGVLRVENTLFTRKEQQYISYVWGDKYKDGLAIRNRYLHGAYPQNIAKQESDYIELLKLMVLIMLKMKEEFEYYSEHCAKSS